MLLKYSEQDTPPLHRGMIRILSLKIGTTTEYLKKYLEKNKQIIADKVTAKKLEIILGTISEEKIEVSGKLSICANQDCSASLKDNIISKLVKNQKAKCPYCNSELDNESIQHLIFSFKRI